jgi:aspartate/methionine/tyrosine aminotransferase
LIVITNLNNPTSELTDNDTLKQVGEIARRVGARVLVDEVYLDALFERTPPSAFHLGNEFVVTNSLTKVYGLSGLRCGWIVAEPELAQRLWRLNDLFGSVAAHPAELLSVLALDNLGRVSARARSILEANNRVLNEFYSTRKDLDAIPHEFGTTSFTRLRKGNVDEFCGLLSEKYETSVVPGRFFEMPQHFRIGLGGEPETLREGLERLGRALDEWGRS